VIFDYQALTTGLVPSKDWPVLTGDYAFDFDLGGFTARTASVRTNFLISDNGFDQGKDLAAF
jgi:hypothetical protein